MSKNVYKLNPPSPQNSHYVLYNCLHLSAGASYPHLMGMPWRARIYKRPCKIDRFCHQWQHINSFVNTHYQNDAFTRPLEGVIFFEKVKNVRNVDGPGRLEELIKWDWKPILVKFVCEAWLWWDETEEEETCGQTQLWAMNLRHLIFQLHWRSSLQQFSVLCCEGGWYSCIHIKYIIGMHNYIHIYKLGSNFSLSP